MSLETPPRIGRALLPLGLVFFSAGISLAVVGPFLSLFLSTEVHAGPVRTTVFLVVAPLAGVLLSTARLGITFVQDMLPGQPGRASTLYSNTFPIGAILAGPLFGLSQHFGYRLAYVITTGLCLAGLLLLIVYRGPGARSRGTDPAARDRRPA